MTASGINIAVLDDYQNAARAHADWSEVERRANVTVFTEHVDDPDSLVEQLCSFDVLCVMRERTPLPGSLLERLPRLQLIVSTGPGNASIDGPACAALGIRVAHTGYSASAAIELTWALILASARNIVDEAVSVRDGGWQRTVGVELAGKTLGVLGLGSIGTRVAHIGRAFGMAAIAWSPNLTVERARLEGVEYVSRETLFADADFLSIHMVLSERSRGMVSGSLLGLMKPQARLINTSRGPIVQEDALVAALRTGRLGGAAIDVFDREPLPADHPFRNLPGMLATPHIGYVSEEQYRVFFGDTVRAILAWLG